MRGLGTQVEGERAGLQTPVMPLVSVIIVVRNGQDNIIGALTSIRQQAYDPLEILVVDGMSEDSTPTLVEEFARREPGIPVRLLENPDRIQATGWNIGIRAARGKYVLRLDAVHCRLEPNYVLCCARTLLDCETKDPAVVAVGGRRVSVSSSANPWSEAIAAAQRSRFGVGNAAYRMSSSNGYVETLGTPLYRKDVLLQVGLFNETLGRSEDNELHARLRRSGFKLYFISDCAVLYYPRTTLTSLASQMFHNGWWVSATVVRMSSFPFGVRHVIPFLFYLALVVSAGLGVAGLVPAGVVFFVLLGVYLAGSVAGALYANRQCFWRVAMVFWVMHACYAGGTLAGCFAGKGNTGIAETATSER